MATFRQNILAASSLPQGAKLRDHLNNLSSGQTLFINGFNAIINEESVNVIINEEAINVVIEDDTVIALIENDISVTVDTNDLTTTIDNDINVTIGCE